MITPAGRRAHALFASLHASAPTLVARAPGRVNLIGEHTDYNDGFVLPMALPYATWMAVRPRDDRRVLLHSEGFGETSIDLDTIDPDTIDPERGVDGWGSHVAGTLWALRASGIELEGFEGTVTTDVPVGASLSSSAALEIVTAVVAFAAVRRTFDPLVAALAGQRAEAEFIGLPSGIMDQLVSAAAVADHALLIDCADHSTTPVPIPDSVVVVVLDTMSRRELAQSEYGKRRADCERAAEILGIRSLRSATAEFIDAHASDLGPRVTNRARHVVTETDRTARAAHDLGAGNVEAFGLAMNASHASLRDLYEVSGPELDTMVEVAQQAPGVLGARMTGGGFAGAAVALVERDQTGAFTDSVSARYTERTGVQPTLHVVRPGAGAGLVEGGTGCD